MHAVRKYLAAHAEPDALLAAAVPGAYERVLVVPAFAEDPGMLANYALAVEAAPGKTICVVVVNGPDDGPDALHTDNEARRDALVGTLDAPDALPTAPHGVRAWLGTYRRTPLDVLVVDHARAGARLPRKEGVGLARKIGTDVALALYAAGKVRSPFLYNTDGDATLPERYFEAEHAVRDAAVRDANARDVAAIVFPVWHTPGALPTVTRATALYELSLRYYVEGLAFAGSPYAYLTIGSAMAPHAEAYAAVRGVPRRNAAEDFYVLNKLAKVGAMARVAGAPIRLVSRESDRVPFGTGASVDKFSRDRPAFYAPGCFHVLRDVIQSLDAFAVDGDPSRLSSHVDVEALRVATRQSTTPDARLSKVHEWFDAFRTLKLVHALRDTAYPNLHYDEALALASFVPAFDATSSAVPGEDFTRLRSAFVEREHARPWLLGPTRRVFAT